MSTARASDPTLEGSLPDEPEAPWSRAGFRPLEIVLLVLLAVLLLGSASLAIRSNDLVADLPLTEDAYYAFSVSAHVAHGDGVTIDGAQATNGFQPLFTFITAPLFAGDDPFVPLRLIILLQVVMFAATGWILGLVVRDAVATPPALGRRGMVLLPMALYLSASFAWRLHLNGLESGFVLLLYVSVWRLYQRSGIRCRADAMTLGLLFGLLVLARIDALFVVGVFVLVYVIRRRAALGRAIADMGVVAIVAAVVSSPWWLYNVIEFGSLLPTSGAAQQLWALDPDRFSNLVRAMAQVSVPWLNFGDRFDRFWPISVLLVASGFALWWVKAQAWSVASGDTPPPADRADRSSEFLVVLLIAGGLLAVWYVTSSWAVHFYPRYLAVLMLPAVYLWAELAILLCGRWARVVVGAVWVALLAAFSYTITFQVAAGFSGNDMWRAQVPLVERTVPASEVVAAGQSGTLGYFRRRVLNLDGKVNAEAYEARDDIPAYLEREGARWLCDWPTYLHRYLGEDPAARGWVERSRDGAFRCLEHVP